MPAHEIILSAAYPAGNPDRRYGSLASSLSRLSGGEHQTRCGAGYVSQPPIRRGTMSLIIRLNLSAAYPAGNTDSARCRRLWRFSQPPIRRGTAVIARDAAQFSQPPIRRGTSSAMALSSPFSTILSAAYPAGNMRLADQAWLCASLSRLSGGELHDRELDRRKSLSRLSGGERDAQRHERSAVLSAAYPAGNSRLMHARGLISLSRLSGGELDAYHVQAVILSAAYPAGNEHVRRRVARSNFSQPPIRRGT